MKYKIKYEQNGVYCEEDAVSAKERDHIIVNLKAERVYSYQVITLTVGNDIIEIETHQSVNLSVAQIRKMNREIISDDEWTRLTESPFVREYEILGSNCRYPACDWIMVVLNDYSCIDVYTERDKNMTVQ